MKHIFLMPAFSFFPVFIYHVYIVVIFIEGYIDIKLELTYSIIKVFIGHKVNKDNIKQKVLNIKAIYLYSN